jgi:condensation domain-containing protein
MCEPAPLSFSQQRLWFLQQWAPGAPTFNAVRAIRLRGDLDIEALRRALDGVLQRHESLRTVVVSEHGEPRQLILDAPRIELPVLDFDAEDGDGVEGLHALLRRLSREPFDLTADLMLRATLIRLGQRDHALLLRIHHIAGDAFSIPVLFADLELMYDAFRAGREPTLPELPIQYADFAVWQRRRLDGPLLQELVDYWTRQLEGAPPVLALPTDRPRLEVQRHEGAHHRFTVPGSVPEGLSALARAEGATFFMVSLAAFAVLLYRLGGEEDVVMGSPIANRTHVDLSHVVGFVSNTVALRIRLAGNPSFREVVRRARETTVGAYAHQELPFEQVVQALRVKRDPAHNPVFQVNFRAQAEPPAPLRLAGLESSRIPVDIGFSRFDLALEVQAGSGELTGYFEYDRDLFDPGTVEGFVDDLSSLLEQVVTDPDTPILALALPRAERAGRRPTTSVARPGPAGRRRRAQR